MTTKFDFTTVTKHSWVENTIEEASFFIPEELSAAENWITFKLEEGDDGKLKKKPHQTEVSDGKYGPFVKWASVQDESQRTDYMSAYEFVKETNKRDDLEGLDGVGFVFTEDDDFIGIDLDDCANEVDDGEYEIKQFANKFLGSVNSFAEFSPSGTGIHIIAKGDVDDQYQQKNDSLGVEIYDEGRFFTVTGNRVAGTSSDVNDCSENIAKLQQRYFDEREMPKNPEIEWEDFSVSSADEADSTAGVSDARVVKTAKDADPEFARLYEGSNHVDDNSGANESDLAFVNKLAFWTQHDAQQAERIWKNSGRSRKKLNRDDYVKKTIRKAFTSNDSNYSGSYKR